jgi:hypothetical protein
VSHGKSAHRATVNGTVNVDVPMRDAHQIEIEQI